MEYHYINNEDTSLFYDLEHNDSDDELINVFLLINKYGDFVNNDNINERDLNAMKRILMMLYERYANHLENVLYKYIYWLFEYKYYVIKQGVEHIALLYHYCKYMDIVYYAGHSFITNEIEDITYTEYIQTVLSPDVLSNVIENVCEIFSKDIVNHNTTHNILNDNFKNELTYDNLFNIKWLSEFLINNAENTDATYNEIRLHKEEVDNYVGI